MNEIVKENLIVAEGISRDFSDNSMKCYFIEDKNTHLIWASTSEKDIAERILKMLKEEN